MGTDTRISGRQKAAILMVALGESASAQVFKHLRPEEIDELTLEIAGIGHVAPEKKQKIVEEFYETALAQEYIAEGGLEYARVILEKALGNERANDVMTRLSSAIQVSPFEFLRRTDASQILNVIANEHPQTVSLILAHLPPGTAAQVPEHLGGGLGAEADEEDGRLLAAVHGRPGAHRRSSSQPRSSWATSSGLRSARSSI